MTSKIQADLRDDTAVVEIMGEITDEVSLALARTLQKCFGYYQYDSVCLSINSPGGAATALRHIVNTMAHWRSLGRKVHTQGNFQVASAGALLLSCGEVGYRAVHSYSAVLYHHARVGATNSPITADAANSMANMLRTADTAMYVMLIDHITQGFGGQERLYAAGKQRCAQLRLHNDKIAAALGETPNAGAPAWLKALEAVYDASSQGGRKKIGAVGSKRYLGRASPATSYVHYLMQRFDQDSRMDLREAWSLCLIDDVLGVDALIPMVREPVAPVVEAAAEVQHKSASRPVAGLVHS